jgi:hypothetical protein
MKLRIALLLFSILLISSPALADDILLDERQSYTVGTYSPDTLYLNGASRGYCSHTYDRLFEDQVYQCQIVRQVWYYTSLSNNNLPNLSERDAWLRFNCWQAMHSSAYYYGGTKTNDASLILNQSYRYSTSIPSEYNFSKPCKLKVPVPEQGCNINSKSIIQSAFAQKFPLDLFIGLQGFSSPPGCPQFTIRGQTFQLCYITKLVKSLKYVLLLVFIISSIIAL